MCPMYMCILLYVKFIWCSSVPQIYGRLQEMVMPALGIFAFFYMWNLFGVVLFHRSMVDWRRRCVCPRYMCILLYVKLFCVVVFHRSMVNWLGVHMPQVYVHSSLCETCSVQWCSIDLWLIGGEGPQVYVHSSICEIYLVQQCSIDLWSIAAGDYVCPRYMYILLYVKLILCSGVVQIYG